MSVEINYLVNIGQCIVKTKDAVLMESLRNKFSIPNEGTRFSKYSPARLYAITPGGKFEPGLLSEVVEAIKEIDIKCSIKLSPSAILTISPIEDPENIKMLDTKDISLRYYQIRIIQKAMSAGRGVCVLGTGGGKTLAIATLINNYYLRSKNKKNFRCLVLVPDRGLVRQTSDDFTEYNVPYTHCPWTAEFDLDTSCNIVVASNKIVQSRFKDAEWLKYVDIVVVDESHKLKNKNKIGKLVNKIHTHSKFGFTGTLPESPIDKWSVIGKLGPVLYEKGSADLREEGYLTDVSVSILRLTHKGGPKTQFTKAEWTSSIKYKTELDYIYNSNFRNNIISKISDNFNNNILILVNHLAHGNILYDIHKDLKDKQVFFVSGSVDIDTRESIKKIMENSNNVVCIAMSSVFSTGINIKNIHMIVFASGGKAFIRIVQSIGRGLRLHSSKTTLLIIDLADKFEYSTNHFEKRTLIYTREKIPYTISTIKE